MVRPSDRPHHLHPVGSVFARHHTSPAIEQRRADPGTGDRLVPQGRGDVLRLSGLGPPVSLACAVFGELYFPGRVHAMASITAPATCGRSASPDNVLVGIS